MQPSALRFDDVRAWRAWLAANHAKATEAFVVLSKKAVPRGLHYLEALEEALCWGWIDGKLHAHDAETFTQRFTPRRADSIWSEANRNRMGRLIREGRARPPGLATVRKAKASGAWDRAIRPSAKPRMPADLRVALHAEPTASDHFRGWGDSYQSACIHWVLDAKRDETRKRRIRRVVQRAAENRRPGIEGF